MRGSHGLLVQQVLANLLENAAKHTRPGTPIEISAGVSDGSVTVSVADRGPGLADDEMQRIFETFYRDLTDPLGVDGSRRRSSLSSRLSLLRPSPFMKMT